MLKDKIEKKVFEISRFCDLEACAIIQGGTPDPHIKAEYLKGYADQLLSFFIKEAIKKAPQERVAKKSESIVADALSQAWTDGFNKCRKLAIDNLKRMEKKK